MVDSSNQTQSDDGQTGAEDIHWDLSDLYASVEDLNESVEETERLAAEFADRHRGQVKGMTAAQLASALREFEQLTDRIGRAYTYVYLNWSTATQEHERCALMQKIREAYTRVSQFLLFFELEWIALDDDHAVRLVESDELLPFRHHLRQQRLLRRHVLSEPEEKILSEKEVTGRSAWVRYFDETFGSARFDFQGRQVTEQEVLSRLHDVDRTIRREAALSLTGGLQRTLRTTTYIFNTILAEKASTDRLRNYPNWLSSRNRGNQVSDDAVDNLVASVCARFDLAARFYHLKKKLLGLDELQDYDRYAPLEQSGRRYSWKEAQQIVLQAYGEFHPRMAEVASLFFDKRWIDAPIRPGKRGGAFSHGAVPSAHPYVFLNYAGRAREVQTLAHELGHGVHQYLARRQGVLHCDTPLTSAETASVFGEMLVFESLLRNESRPANRLAMLVSKIDDSMATVFRQISMNRFEDAVHTARRAEGELSSDRLCDIWIETQKKMFQGSVTLGQHYRCWWSYIPHFVHTPGYVYAYAFGELLVLALFARYRQEGPEFAPRYLELLAAGGSDWPHRLMSKLGVDLTDFEFWQQGLGALEDLIRQAEELAESL